MVLSMNLQRRSKLFGNMGLTFIQTDKLIIPVILCDACGERLYIGTGLIIWDEKHEIKFICKGKEQCNKYSDYNYADTLECFFYKLCYNTKLGILKKTKIKW